MNLESLASEKISTSKYKNLSFLELANQIFHHDKKYLQTLTRSANTSKSNDTKLKIQNFLNFFFQHFEPSQSVPQSAITQTHPFWEPSIIDLRHDTQQITHILHISDIHIRLYNRSKEYNDVFQKLYVFLHQKIEENPNQIIIITGDLLHSKNTLSPECIITTQNFLIQLASIAPTILIAGNHDALLTNNQREDSITAIVEKIPIPNFYYLKNSAVYLYNNLAIAVNSLLDNQWIFANSFQIPSQITHKIALFHGCVGLCDTGVGHRLRGEKIIEDFDGYDYVLLGDIHKFQFLDPEQKRIAYASSLIAQNFNEWNSPHGVLHWDLLSQNHQYYPIHNDYGFFVFNLANNQIKIEDTPIIPENIKDHLKQSSMNIKLNIQNCTSEFLSKINYLVKQSCKDVKLIHNYLGTKTKETHPEIILDSNSLLLQFIQKNHPQLQTQDTQFILEKYHSYSHQLNITNEDNIARWELIDLEFSNLFGYGPNNYINFEKFSSDNPIGIIAPNSHGKSSLIDIVLLTLFTKFSRSRGTGISKDIINVNANNFSSKLKFKIGSDIYVILKEGKREQSDKIKITKNEFFKQTDALIVLTDEDRKKTDKVISDLIGTYDDFIFTNVQLQNRNNSFKEMTDKERKEYLYKILKLNLWNDVAKKISEDSKPLKNAITYLEKNIENKSSEELNDKLQDIELKFLKTQDLIEQQYYEKEICLNEIEVLRLQIVPNISDKYQEKEIQNDLLRENINLRIFSEQIDELQSQIKTIKTPSKYISQKDRITQKYLQEKKNLDQQILKIKSHIQPIQTPIPTQNLWNKIKYPGNSGNLGNLGNLCTQEILLLFQNNLKSLSNEKNDLDLDELNFDIGTIEEKISEIKNRNQSNQNEITILQNKMHNISEIPKLTADVSDLKSKLKTKTKEKDIVLQKITNFQAELESETFMNLQKEEPIFHQLTILQEEEEKVSKLISDLEKHQYDPKCKFCIKHPIVQQKQDQMKLLQKIQSDITTKQKSITTKNFLETQNLFKQISEKLNEKMNKIPILDNQILKLELELEKINVIQEKINLMNQYQKENEQYLLQINNHQEAISQNNQEIHQNQKKLKYMIIQRENLANLIDTNNETSAQIQTQLNILQQIVEIDIQNQEIEKKNNLSLKHQEEIDNLLLQFNQSSTAEEYESLQIEIQNEMSQKLEISHLQNKLQSLEFQKLTTEKEIKSLENILQEIANSQEIIFKNNEYRSKIIEIQSTISKKDNLIAKLNEKFGIQHQQFLDTVQEKDIYLQQLEELNLKKNELKLTQILEQSLGKDGLPLIILQNYLTPITQSINNIISPFISRVINLKIENDDLILDSFPDSNEKSVYIHGGMESFILDIAFKITLSNFAKLPKCDILFLDEGISAFDSERLSNIDSLFNFIKRYFSKTILITHIDSVKENIFEKITITKENNLSKIICEYNT